MALGIDVGGTKIAAGIVSFPDARVAARQIPTSAARGGEAVLSDVARLAEELTLDAKSAAFKLQGIGLALCELVDPSGRILSANCVRWQDQPVLERLSRLGKVTIEADVRAAGLAEALFGAGKPFRQFLYVTIGTGISCCLMIEGKPFTGARGATGTMASSPLPVACEKCGHANRRTLEEIASGPALVTRFNQRRPGHVKSGEEVLAAAASGQADAVEIVRSGGEAMGAALGLLINVLDPEAVVVGGGLGLSKGIYWDSLVLATRRHVWADVNRDLPIIQAATGQDAALIGAAARAWMQGPTSYRSSGKG
jgi:glucokinase